MCARPASRLYIRALPHGPDPWFYHWLVRWAGGPASPSLCTASIEHASDDAHTVAHRSHAHPGLGFLEVQVGIPTVKERPYTRGCADDTHTSVIILYCILLCAYHPTVHAFEHAISRLTSTQY